MKIRIKTVSEQEVSAIRVVAAVRYEQEDMPNDYPHRIGDTWSVVIDIESGQIRDWPEGVPPRDLNMKVCDQGCYYLLSPTDSVVAARESEYVVRCAAIRRLHHIQDRRSGQNHQLENALHARKRRGRIRRRLTPK